MPRSYNNAIIAQYPGPEQLLAAPAAEVERILHRHIVEYCRDGMHPMTTRDSVSIGLFDANGYPLVSKKALVPSVGLYGIGPTIHQLAAYECLNPLQSILGEDQQPVHIVRSTVDAKLGKWHLKYSSCRWLFTLVFHRMRPPHYPTATSPQISTLLRF